MELLLIRWATAAADGDAGDVSTVLLADVFLVYGHVRSEWVSLQP